MHTANPADHYKPVSGDRRAPLVATYAHTTPLVPPVPIPATTKPTAVATTTTSTTVTKSAPVVVSAATTPVVYASEPRANQVVEVLYPSAQSRTDTIVTAAPTQQQTTTTTTTRPAAVAAVATAATTTRRPLDLDMTATSIDSSSAPTPIHLTIHPDPEEDTGARSAETAAVASSNAISYLHSVHPALPVTTTGGGASTLQQPQPVRERRLSEGAATSVNGLWTPLSTEAAAAQVGSRAMQSSPAPVHGDQVYASEAPPIPARPLTGSVVSTNTHDQQYYDNRARVDRDAGMAAAAVTGAAVGSAAAYHHQAHGQLLDETHVATVQQVSDASNLAGGYRTPLMAQSMAAGPMVVGQAGELGSAGELREVDDISTMGGAERVAVAYGAQRAMPGRQVFASTGGPQIVQVGSTSALSGQRLDVAGLAAGPMVVGETRQLGGGEQFVQVDDMSRLSNAERVAVTSAAQRAMPSNQVFTSTTGPSITQVDNVSSLRGTPLALSAMAAGPLVVGVTQQVGGGEQLQQVDDLSRLSHAERLALASTAQREMPGRQVFASTGGPQIVQVDHTSALSGQRFDVGGVARGPLVMGAVEQVGSMSNIEQVNEMRGERFAVAGMEQRAMPGNQVFTSTTGPQIVHTGNAATYNASHSVAMGTPYTQRLDNVSGSPSITQVDNTSALRGERLAVAGLAAGSMVVGETRQLGGGEQFVQVDDMSRFGNVERVAVAAAEQRAMPSNQTFASTGGSQIVHTGVTTTSNPSMSSAMGTAYTQRLDEVGSGSSITQVGNTSSLSGQRFDVGGVAHGPLVVGSTQQVGNFANIEQVNEMRGERLAVASLEQRAMPSNQVFASTAGSQIVQTGITTIGSNASQSRAMGTAYTQRLDEVGSAPSITQVGNTSSMSGQRLDVGGVARGPLVVGATQQVGSMSNVEQVGEMRGERLAVGALEQRAMPGNQVFTSTGGSQIVQTGVTSYNPSQSSVTGTAYTQRLDEVGGTSSITQVDSTSALRGERLALSNAAAQSTIGTLHTHQLSGVSQPQIRYTDQASTYNTQPIQQNVQNVQQTTTTTQQRAVTQLPVTTEQTTITREAVSAAEAAAATTSQSLNVSTEPVQYESRTEHVGAGPVEVLHVDAARLAGKEQLGSEAFSVAKEQQAAVDAVSGGMKDMQLTESDKEQPTYRRAVV